jgi:Cep192 domain 4
MIVRVVLFAALLPVSALAQLQVFEFDGANYIPVGALLNVGTAAPGDTIDTRFRVRNMGNGPALLDKLALSGEGFSITSAPFLPYTLAPYVGPTSEAEFRVRFTPTSTGSFGAFLAVNTLNIALQGNAVSSASVMLSGSNAPLAAGQTVDFGSVAVGASQTQTFLLFNPSNASITVSSVIVSGAGFGGPTGLSFPVQIGPGQSPSFQVTFKPQSGTPAQGTLAVDQRIFNLTAQGLTPSLPDVSIVFASTVGASAQQNSVSIPLASASQAAGNGTLTMEFQPGIAGVTDDTAIQFLSGPQRKATVSISIGDTSAKVGGLASMAFQTGTTAGTITFTLTLPNGTQQSTLTIPPSPIVLDTVTAVRRAGALDVAFSGFDNTYSASQLAFTFYDLKGNALPQGVFNVNVAPYFQQYFSTTQVGGSFALLATFQVQGDTSQIGSVTAQFTNSAGSTTAQQIPFVN